MKNAYAIALMIILMIAGCASQEVTKPAITDAKQMNKESVPPLLSDAKTVIDAEIIWSFDKSQFRFIKTIHMLQAETFPPELLPPNATESPDAAYVKEINSMVYVGTPREGLTTHEICHAFWMNKKVPFQDQFADSIKQAMNPKQEMYEGFAIYIKGISKIVRKMYPREMYLNEVYSYLTTSLVMERGANFPIPQDIQRHYKGILSEAAFRPVWKD